VSNITVVAHSGKLRHDARRALKDAFFMAGVEPAWIDVAKAKKATKAAHHAVEDGADIVVACGGDGTVRAAAEALVGTSAALAVFPVGTANLFATAYGLPSKADEVVALVCSGGRRRVDSGVCNDRTFNVMAGAGFDARMIDDADDHKERYGMLAYLRAGLRQARAGDRFDAQVAVDGEPFFAGPAACVLVGNIGTLKGGIAAFPAASPDDGVLDIGVVTAVGLREWAGVLAKTVGRRPDTSANATIGQGTTIEVLLDGKHRFQLDGGSKGTTDELHFSVRPGALTMCAPAP
jgi:YegS/Rv2252/BmrU family lipid kinase